MSLTAGLSTSILYKHNPQQLGDCLEILFFFPIGLVSTLSVVTICTTTAIPYVKGVSAMAYATGLCVNRYK